MRWRNLAEAGFIFAVLGIAIYVNHKPKAPPPTPAAQEATPAVSGFGTFCRRAHLVPKAFDDCRRAMAAAKTDAERVAIERRFAMGNVQLDEPAPTAQP